ncbi:MAG: HU family DNA-binding protein [Cyanobacteria bacterium CAN_BIN43]|nr:HU family DNA-binding protein [Cyanobacteria bacterium CAN_BIN43]
MNRGELVAAIAQKTSVGKREADAILTTIAEEIMAAVNGSNKVTFVSFGSFEPRERQARFGRNSKTGQAMTINATRVPAFAAGKSFKDKVAPAA